MNAELNQFFEDLDKQAGNVDANSEQKNNDTSGAAKKARAKQNAHSKLSKVVNKSQKRQIAKQKGSNHNNAIVFCAKCAKEMGGSTENNAWTWVVPVPAVTVIPTLQYVPARDRKAELEQAENEQKNV